MIIGTKILEKEHMKRKSQNITSIIIKRVAIILFAVLLVIGICGAVLFKMDSVRNSEYNGISEVNVASAVVEDAFNGAKAIGESYSVNPDLRSFLINQDHMSYAERFSEIMNIISDLRREFFLHDYMHSFCIVTKDRESFHATNNIGNSFLPFFEETALDGNKIDDFSGFSKVYTYPVTSGNNHSINMISYVCSVVRLTGEGKETLGKIIINLNLDDILGSIQKRSQTISSVGIYDGNNNTVSFVDDETAESIKIMLDKREQAHSERNTQIFMSNEISGSSIRLLTIKQGAERYNDISPSFMSVFLIMAITLFSILLLSLYFMLSNFSNQIKTLNAGINEVSTGNLDYKVNLNGSNEIVNISNGFNNMTARIKENTQKIVENERKEQQLSFELLLAQINPHFIYNTLDSVIYLARKNKCDDIIQLVSSFIVLLQDSIHLGESNIWTPIKSELVVINKYITIQHFRYGNRFSYKEDVDPELLDLYIPKSIIVPLIENAIVHGICESDIPGTIVLEINKNNSRLNITVKDSGAGMTEQILSSLKGENGIRQSARKSGMYSIGLNNILDRLKLLYGSDYTFDIRSQLDYGTEVLINIPCRSEITENLPDKA